MPIPAIILAAGASRRLGQPKQLVVYQGERLLERAARLAREAGASPVLLVLGANFELISTSMKLHDEVVVHNEQWPEGISTSIQAGMHALRGFPSCASGVLIMSCDQPWLTAEYLQGLISKFESMNPKAVVASAYAGIHGVPAIFPNTMFEALDSLRGDKGARALIERSSGSVVALPFAGGEVDIDRPEDLERLR